MIELVALASPDLLHVIVCFWRIGKVYTVYVYSIANQSLLHLPALSFLPSCTNNLNTIWGIIQPHIYITTD